jgi:hypothetical protein
MLWLFVFNGLRGEVVVCLDIGGIVDHHCLISFIVVLVGDL